MPRYAESELETVELRGTKAVRVRGWHFANQEEGFWARAFVVGFAVIARGFLVNADHMSDAFDEGADFVVEQEATGLWAKEEDVIEAESEGEDSYVRLGNWGTPFPGAELWCIEVPMSEVPETTASPGGDNHG